jgi:hypothetical protein
MRSAYTVSGVDRHKVVRRMRGQATTARTTDDLMALLRDD